MLNWPDFLGELHAVDESTPDKVTKLVTGDVINIDHDTHITYTSPNKAKSKDHSNCNMIDTDSNTLPHSLCCLLLSIAPPRWWLRSSEITLLATKTVVQYQLLYISDSIVMVLVLANVKYSASAGYFIFMIFFRKPLILVSWVLFNVPIILDKKS